MEPLDRDLVRGRAFAVLSALLLPGLLAVGCVGLTKPLDVQKCSASGTCSDDPNKFPHTGDDAKNDTVENPGPDLSLGDDVPIIKPDAGPDVPPAVADGPPDTADTATVNKDTTSGDVDRPVDTADASPPPADVPAEKATGPEPGPEPRGGEPGAEPSSGPEPGPEPKPEPSSGFEPGPEPKPEPSSGPEPGPEPPRDSGTPDTAPPSNCNIFYGATPATGTQGHPPGATSTGGFCVATCDDIQGWDCSNIGNRTVSVNGAAVTCGAVIAKKNGYYVFRVSPGTPDYSSIFWFAPNNNYASSCPAPDGGVFP